MIEFQAIIYPSAPENSGLQVLFNLKMSYFASKIFVYA